MDHTLDLWCHLLQSMQPIRGRGRGRIDRQGHGRGHGPNGEGGRGTSEPTLPPLSPTPIFAPDTSIPPILTHHPILTYPPYLPIITRYFHISPYLPITRYFYTPTDLHITFHTPTNLHIFTISSVARASFHGSRYHLIIPYIASYR